MIPLDPTQVQTIGAAGFWLQQIKKRRCQKKPRAPRITRHEQLSAKRDLYAEMTQDELHLYVRRFFRELKAQ